MNISSPSLEQILFLLLLYDFTIFLSAFSHLLSFQRYRPICETFKKLISWPFLWTLLLLPFHSKSPIFLPLSLLLLFSSFWFFIFIFIFFCFCYLSFFCFGLHCFPHSSRCLVIFTSPVF